MPNTDVDHDEYVTRLDRSIEVAIKCRMTGFVKWLLEADRYPFGRCEGRLMMALDETIRYRRPQLMTVLLSHAAGKGISVTAGESMLTYVYKKR